MRNYLFSVFLRGFLAVSRDRALTEKFEQHRKIAVVLGYSLIPVVIANSALVTQVSGRKNKEILKSNNAAVRRRTVSVRTVEQGPPGRQTCPGVPIFSSFFYFLLHTL